MRSSLPALPPKTIGLCPPWSWCQGGIDCPCMCQSLVQTVVWSLRRRFHWLGEQQAEVGIRKAEEEGKRVIGVKLCPLGLLSWAHWTFHLCCALVVLKNSDQFDDPCGFSLCGVGIGFVTMKRVIWYTASHPAFLGTSSQAIVPGRWPSWLQNSFPWTGWLALGKHSWVEILLTNQCYVGLWLTAVYNQITNQTAGYVHDPKESFDKLLFHASCWWPWKGQENTVYLVYLKVGQWVSGSIGTLLVTNHETKFMLLGLP